MKRLDGIYKPTPAERIERDWQIWLGMINKYGPNGVAQKMVKLPSFRKYVQRYPYDLTSAQYDPLEGEDGYITIEAKQPSVEEDVGTRIEFEKAIDSLSAKTKKVWELLEQGKTHKEIVEILGLNTENASRWHKHQIKRALQSYLDEQDD